MAINSISGASLDGILQLLQGSGFLRTRSGSAGRSPSSADGLRDTYRLSLGLRKTIGELQRALQHSFSYHSRMTPSTAASSITLEATTASILNGNEEVNVTPTSFSPFAPSWTGRSTSRVSLSGVYNGADGTTVQTLRVTTAGTVGGTKALVLRSTINGRNEDVTIPAGTPANAPITLPSGIILRLSAGSLAKNDEISINLSNTVGSAVDPDKPCNGTGQDYPNLQYGLNVADGSFILNGVSISVSAADTLNQVLARITGSAAGVTAAFDAATETVKLTQKSRGPEPISFGSDSSGFLAAVKLTGAIPVLGIHESTERIGDVAKLSGVASGTAFVNGVSISVDTATDSMTDVVARINASAAGVTASIADGQIRITAGTPFTLEDGTSRFFTTIGIAEGSYGSPTSGGMVGAKDVVDAMKQFSEQMNELFKSSSTPASVKSRLRQTFQSIAAGAFHKSGPRFESGLGVRMDFSSDDKVIEFSEKDRAALMRALQGRPASLRKLFMGSISGEGESFLDMLTRELNSLESDIEDQLGGTGLLVNVSA